MLRKACLAAVAWVPSLCMAQASATWDFVVRLDEKPVGTHRFVLEDKGGVQHLTSEARFDVTVLGLTVYRYRHQSKERWRDGCLEAIEATTDSNGTTTEVRGRLTPAGFMLQGRPQPVEGCLMTFAYWHPELPSQNRLLDPGSGDVVPVRVRPQAAREWRIEGLPNPIVIRRDPRDRWSELDTQVGGRRLSYRFP